MIPENYIFNIHKYGAVGDGVTLDTSALQSAINACTAVGGGMAGVGNSTYRGIRPGESNQVANTNLSTYYTKSGLKFYFTELVLRNLQ